jgi:S-adenosylmethionine hydrolase
MRPIITLLTDFGTADGYVGEIKGVLLTRVRDAQLIDITHDVPPQDVESARLAVARTWRRFPEGTVHIVIVDPGVGSEREGLAVASDSRFLVGPDNGVLSPALLFAAARAVTLPIAANAAPTFHGRDVFAPAAADLATGAALDALGTEATGPLVRRTPEAHRLADGSVRGEVIAVDRFGNAITNLMGLRGGVIDVNGSTLSVRRTYADVPARAAVAVVGSLGLIEIAVRDGNAALELRLARGSVVVMRPSRERA